MIASTQITNTEIFAFIAVLVFKFLSCKVLFINRKGNRNCQKTDYFSRKWQISWVNYCKIMNSWKAKFIFRFFDLYDCTFKNCDGNLYIDLPLESVSQRRLESHSLLI